MLCFEIVLLAGSDCPPRRDDVEVRRLNTIPHPSTTPLPIYKLCLSFPTLQSIMIRPASITSLKDLRVSYYEIAAFDRIPNTSIQRKPLLVYHSAFAHGTSASSIEAHLSAVGVVDPQWRCTMYSTSHFHSSSHEVLCVSSGRAQLCFGGEGNPKRVELEIAKGDVIVVPAGVAHHLREDLEGGFSMVGSYPTGKSFDICYGREGEEERVKGIETLGWFERDPIYGDTGPALQD